MSKRLILLILFLCVATLHTVEGESPRNYYYYGNMLFDDQEPDDWEEDADEGVIEYFKYNSEELCPDCFFVVTDSWYRYFSSKNHHGIDFNSIPTFMNQEGEGCYCWSPKFYAGYLHFLYKNDLPFLKKQIAYAKKDHVAEMFWPEMSSQAMTINHTALYWFEDLVRTTALKKVGKNSSLAKKFMVKSWYFAKLEEITHIALCSTCFHFSDYFQVCQDLKAFSKDNFKPKECAEIEGKLIDILDALAPLFRELYQEALSATAMPEIRAELELIEDLYNDWEMDTLICSACSPSYEAQGVCQQPITHSPSLEWSGVTPCVQAKPRPASQLFCPLVLPNENPSPPAWCSAPHYLARGMLYNDHLLFVDAIKVLSDAIELDSTSSAAYLERAHAYFESGKIDLALADYGKMTTLKTKALSQSVVPLGGLDYSHGLCLGIVEGSYVSAEELGPCMINSAQGLLHGLWAFACSPAQVSQEILDCSKALILTIRSQTAWEYCQMVVPELRELCCDWEILAEHDRGRKMGYIIGKYGMDIFTPMAGAKLYQKYRVLKAANTAFTLECMSKTKAQHQAILAASSAQAAKRAEITQAALSGKLVLKNANQATHIITKEHRWDQVISLSGNPQEDCRRALHFLEQHQVVAPANAGKARVFSDKRTSLFSTTRYKKQIGACEVEVIMEHNLVSGEILVQNAYVVDPRRGL